MEKKRIIILSLIAFLFIVGITCSYIYYNNKYSIKFITNTDEEILTKYVKKGQTISKPTKLIKEGYVFVEWQLDGKKYNFNSKISRDIVLKAKWLKEKYSNVTFNTDNHIKIKSEKVLYGSSIEELPSISKDGYEFLGWYLGDKIYNGEIINTDIVLEAKYKPIYNIGDIVIIVGNYADNKLAVNAYNSKAIGWSRMILSIDYNSNFPYELGNKFGTTGFFKVESIIKV